MEGINYPCSKQDYKVLIKTITYNQAKYIQDALNGVAMQKTCFPFVEVVIDDCSTDGEQGVIKSWLNENCDMTNAEFIDIPTSEVIIVRHKTNLNCTFAIYFLKRNLWKEPEEKRKHFTPWENKCKYIALCEGDDYWIDENKLQQQVRFLEDHKEYTAVIHNAVKVRDGMVVNQYDILPSDGDIIPEMAILGGGGFCATNSILYRTTVAKTAPKEVFTQFVGDYPLQMYLTFAGKVRYFHDIMSAYRIFAFGSWSMKNISVEEKKNMIKDKKRLYSDMDRISGGRYSKYLRKAKYADLFYDAKYCKLWFDAFIYWIRMGAPLDKVKIDYIPQFLHSLVCGKKS